MKHGGDILSYQDLYDGEILDFSSNINPLGPPKSLKPALIEGFSSLKTYPDIKYRNLKQEVADYLGCDTKEVIVGNGAVEIINNFASMFNRVIVYTPCFAEYIERPEVFNKEIIKLKLGDNFKIDEELLYKNVKEGDLIILGNPNNPTGRRIELDKLIKIHDIVSTKGAFLLLDEAFYEFCPEDYDSIKLFYNSISIGVIRAATKFFSLPGIRLGYAFANHCMVEKYDAIALPWSVNSFAEAAGRNIFKDNLFIKESRKYIHGQIKYMLGELKKIKNIRVFNTDTNFILIKLLKYDEDFAFDYLIRRGILIRKASSFEGLDKTYIRVAVKDFESNKKLIENLRECLL